MKELPKLHIMGGLECVRFFPDRKGRSTPFVGHMHIEYGTEEYYKTIEEMQAAGNGAFFSVNRTDGKGAKAENIVAVRSYYVDIDGLRDKDPGLELLISAKLKPSAIVETKNGVHAYWYAKNGVPVDYLGYRQVQTGLVEAFGGDMSARDIARVLRIPGTRHQKDEPFEVRIIHQLPEAQTPYYTAEEILAHYPAPRPPEWPRYEVVNSPKSWRLFIEDLEKWNPVPGERNMVMLISAGVAIGYGVAMEDYVGTMYPVVRRWETGRDVAGELRRVARWAYSRGNSIPASTLRRRGIPIRYGL